MSNNNYGFQISLSSSIFWLRLLETRWEPFLRLHLPFWQLQWWWVLVGIGENGMYAPEAIKENGKRKQQFLPFPIILWKHNSYCKMQSPGETVWLADILCWELGSCWNWRQLQFRAGLRERKRGVVERGVKWSQRSDMQMQSPFLGSHISHSS